MLVEADVLADGAAVAGASHVATGQGVRHPIDRVTPESRLHLDGLGRGGNGDVAVEVEPLLGLELAEQLPVLLDVGDVVAGAPGRMPQRPQVVIVGLGVGHHGGGVVFVEPGGGAHEAGQVEGDGVDVVAVEHHQLVIGGQRRGLDEVEVGVAARGQPLGPHGDALGQPVHLDQGGVGPRGAPGLEHRLGLVGRIALDEDEGAALAGAGQSLEVVQHPWQERFGGPHAQGENRRFRHSHVFRPSPARRRLSQGIGSGKASGASSQSRTAAARERDGRKWSQAGEERGTRTGRRLRR